MQRRMVRTFSPIIIASVLLVLLLSSIEVHILASEQGQDDVSVRIDSIHSTETTGELSRFLGQDQGGAIRFSPNHVIVKFRNHKSPLFNSFGKQVDSGSQSLNDMLVAQGVERGDPLFPKTTNDSPLTTDNIDIEQVYRLYLSPDRDVMDVIAALSAHPDVIYAEPDYLAHAAFLCDDPHFPDQWGLSQIQAESAWNTTQGNAAVTIAIIDTGIDLNHPDLANKLWVNPGEIAGNGIDDDGNGKIDDVNGWDWVGYDNTPQDDIGHGTHVAGITAAATNNNIGIAGVCPNCRVMSLKVLDAGGSGACSDIAAGIIYAADKGAKVINLSLGGYADSQLLRDAVAYASQYAVVIAAAGNDNKQDRFYPAAYDEYVVAVAATDNNDQKAAFANYGDWVI
ncbi:MAG: S8 family serine peptidase [bacterium]|nr:S8 family serine peptidase [bacterium]